MMKSWLFGALLVAIGCGGRDAAVGVDAIDASASDGAGLAGPIFRALIAQERGVGQPGPALSYDCLDRALPVGHNGLPNCIVVSALLTAGATGQELADCRRCNAPGFEPFVAPMPLERIGEGLSDYACICAVRPLARDLACPTEHSSTASWCYSDKAPGPSGVCSPRPGPILGFSGGAGTQKHLYVACFEPSATQ